MTANRLQMYAAVYAFERDIRDIVNRYLVKGKSLEAILGVDEHSLIMARIAKPENEPIDIDPIDMMDLRPSYDLLNRHRSELPSGLADEVRANTERLDTIVPIRQRLMHARPLASDDSEKLVSALSCFTHSSWQGTQSVIEKIGMQGWVPDIVPEVYPDRVLHNLPAADYDETGLIGRQAQVDRLAKMLTHGRDSVVTLTGEGGIGKTALALDIAYKLVEEHPDSFDAILWVSLKQEKLTGIGVQQMRASISNLAGAAEKIGRDLDSSFRGGVEQLADSLHGLNVLICLDNLETVSGEEFVEMYEVLPDTIKYLVTSRNGIGQIERRYQVEPLEISHALALMSKLIKSRDVTSLKKLSREAREQISEELRRSPLGIKWWVLACAAGRPPAELIRDQSELLEFCVRSVYDSLSTNAQRITIALDALSGEASLHRLTVLTGDSLNDSALALQELVQGSLVQSRVEYSSDMETFVALTETARRFLGRAVPSDDPIRNAVLESDNVFRRDEERRMQDIAARRLDPVVVHHRRPSDSATCQKLRLAVIESKDGSVDHARKLVGEAREMAPDFWEVDRVDAFIESYHQPPEVVSNKYRQALQKCNSDEERAICSHFFSGHLSRNVKDLAGALEHAEYAHQNLDTPETLLGLGNARIRLRKFESGIDVLAQAERLVEGKTRLIAATSLVAAYRRWSEYCSTEERNLQSALVRALQALDFGLKEYHSGVVDARLSKATRDSMWQLIRVVRSMEQGGVDFPSAEWSMKIDEIAESVRLSPDWKDALVAGGQLSLKVQERLGLSSLFRALPLGENLVDEGVFIGKIVSVLSRFGFIRHPSFPENVFFHAGVVRGSDFDSFEQEDEVRFAVNADGDRIRAEWVELV